MAELQTVRPGFLVVYEESAARIPELRAAGGHICLRMFSDFEEPFKLAERAETFARQYLQPGDCLTWANEMNHELPQLSVDQTVAYCKEFIDWWRHFGWPAALCSPALSPSAPNSDLTPYQHTFLACDYIGVHAYAGAEQHIDQAEALWPRYRKLVTEFGTPTGDRAAYCRDFLTRLSGRPTYVGACWFLWDSPEEQWRSWIAKDTPVEEVLRTFEPPQGGSSDPGGDAMVVEELRTYAAWADARIHAAQEPRDKNAFVAHLTALGADYSDPRRYGWPC